MPQQQRRSSIKNGAPCRGCEEVTASLAAVAERQRQLEELAKAEALIIAAGVIVATFALVALLAYIRHGQGAVS